MDIERLAATPGSEMPEGLKLAEQLLFLTLRELYNNFRNGVITRDQGSMEKARIMRAYKHVELEHEIAEHHKAIRKRLEYEVGSLYKCGCETCQKVARIMDGIDKKDLPESLEEVHQWNKKLRELVKERSDRAAELATQLDRVRWALEKDAPAEEILKNIKEVVAK